MKASRRIRGCGVLGQQEEGVVETWPELLDLDWGGSRGLPCA